MATARIDTPDEKAKDPKPARKTFLDFSENNTIEESKRIVLLPIGDDLAVPVPKGFTVPTTINDQPALKLISIPLTDADGKIIHDGVTWLEEKEDRPESMLPSKIFFHPETAIAMASYFYNVRKNMIDILNDGDHKKANEFMVGTVDPQCKKAEAEKIKSLAEISDIEIIFDVSQFPKAKHFPSIAFKNSFWSDRRQNAVLACTISASLGQGLNAAMGYLQPGFAMYLMFPLNGLAILNQHPTPPTWKQRFTSLHFSSLPNLVIYSGLTAGVMYANYYLQTLATGTIKNDTTAKTAQFFVTVGFSAAAGAAYYFAPKITSSFSSLLKKFNLWGSATNPAPKKPGTEPLLNISIDAKTPTI